MKYRIDTKQIDGHEYITACTLVSALDCQSINPRYLIDQPINVADDNNRLQYAIVNNSIINLPQEYTETELAIKEIASLKAYLSSTDYIYPKCLELGLSVNVEYPEVVQKRKEARARIQTLTQSDREVKA